MKTGFTTNMMCMCRMLFSQAANMAEGMASLSYTS